MMSYVGTAAFIGFMTILAVTVTLILSSAVMITAFTMYMAHKENKAYNRRLAVDNLENLIYMLYGVEMRPSYYSYMRKAIMRHRINGGSSTSYWLPPGSRRKR